MQTAPPESQESWAPGLALLLPPWYMTLGNSLDVSALFFILKGENSSESMIIKTPNGQLKASWRHITQHVVYSCFSFSFCLLWTMTLVKTQSQKTKPWKAQTVKLKTSLSIPFCVSHQTLSLLGDFWIARCAMKQPCACCALFHSIVTCRTMTVITYPKAWFLHREMYVA